MTNFMKILLYVHVRNRYIRSECLILFLEFLFTTGSPCLMYMKHNFSIFFLGYNALKESYTSMDLIIEN